MVAVAGIAPPRGTRAGPARVKGWCTVGAGQVAHCGPAASRPWKWDHGRAKISGSSVRGRAHDIAPAGRLGDVRRASGQTRAVVGLCVRACVRACLLCLLPETDSIYSS